MQPPRHSRKFWQSIGDVNRILIPAFLIFGALQIYCGFAGLHHQFGTTWTVVAAVIVFTTRIYLPLAIGSFIYAHDIWDWHWFFSLLFALPTVALMVPVLLIWIKDRLSYERSAPTDYGSANADNDNANAETRFLRFMYRSGMFVRKRPLVILTLVAAFIFSAGRLSVDYFDNGDFRNTYSTTFSRNQSSPEPQNTTEEAAPEQDASNSYFDYGNSSETDAKATATAGAVPPGESTQGGYAESTESINMDPVRRSTLTFHGFDCTIDCSGHQAGWDWAETNDIKEEYLCDGKSKSFDEGCQAYVRQNN